MTSPLDVALPSPWAVVASLDLTGRSRGFPLRLSDECYWCAGPVTDPGHEECQAASVACVLLGLSTLALLARLRGESRALREPRR